MITSGQKIIKLESVTKSYKSDSVNSENRILELERELERENLQVYQISEENCELKESLDNEKRALKSVQNKLETETKKFEHKVKELEEKVSDLTEMGAKEITLNKENKVFKTKLCDALMMI